MENRGTMFCAFKNFETVSESPGGFLPSLRDEKIQKAKLVLVRVSGE
jgi:hypothetical protein